MKSLQHSRVNIMISDMTKAITFYVDVLGLKLINQWGDHYAEVHAKDLLIGLHPFSGNVTVGSNMSVGFGVSEFDETVRSLESKGIEFKIAEEGWVRLAYFTDPDGNLLYLAENTGDQ